MRCAAYFMSLGLDELGPAVSQENMKLLHSEINQIDKEWGHSDWNIFQYDDTLEGFTCEQVAFVKIKVRNNDTMTSCNVRF